MGPRNMLILFFSTLCVSLVLLIILFSFGFKDIDLEFNTKMPESAPDLGSVYKDAGPPSSSKSDMVSHATIRVPQSAGHPLDALNGISPTDDTAPDKDNVDNSQNMTPPAPPTPPVPGLAVADKAEKQEKAEKAPAEKPSAKTEAPTELKPLVSPSVMNAHKPSAEIQKTEAQKTETSAKTDKLTPLINTGADTAKTATYQVYVDGFATREAAQAAAETMKASGAVPFVRTSGSGFMVQVGVFSSKDNADAMAGKTGAKVRKL